MSKVNSRLRLVLALVIFATLIASFIGGLVAYEESIIFLGLVSVICVLLLSNFVPNIKLSKNWTYILIALVISIIASIYFSLDTNISVLLTCYYIAQLLFLVTFSRFILHLDDTKSANLLVYSVLIAGLLNGFAGLYQYLFLFDTSLYLDRLLNFPLGWHNLEATFLLSISLLGFSHYLNVKRKIFLIVGSLLGILGLLTFSRLGIFLYVLVLGYILIRRFPVKKVLGTFAIVLIGLAFVGALTNYQRLISGSWSLNHRFYLWSVSLLAVISDLKRFFVGYGPGSISVVQRIHSYLPWVGTNYSLNAYLDVLVENGIIIFCLFIFAVSFFCIKFIRRRGENWFYLSPFVLISLHSVLDLGFTLPVFQYFAVLFLIIYFYYSNTNLVFNVKSAYLSLPRRVLVFLSICILMIFLISMASNRLVYKGSESLKNFDLTKLQLISKAIPFDPRLKIFMAQLKLTNEASPEEALVYVNQALRLSPYDEENLAFKAFIYESMGELDSANNIYKEMIKISPYYNFDKYEKYNAFLERNKMNEDLDLLYKYLYETFPLDKNYYRMYVYRSLESFIYESLAMKAVSFYIAKGDLNTANQFGKLWQELYRQRH